ncbi:Crp/Fnr family transcriptional regulator [Kushneria indalinina]|uniref:CRP-like cAMP-binding protein n=1 Tax=Kushneria indalinina DSM 14324 TaxID=1122140 RepID=A0A3D9DW01_9GAMM|nr:Crp/Fnr family transcriptional regulator [Kushneria indalinina]REC94835.1 CRP-like cAMP-binding protein [Kushneria indalinina DSM 14324]
MYSFINKMNFYSCLTHEEKAAIQGCVDSKHYFAKGQTLARAGEKPDRINIVTEGWACRFKSAHDGTDQAISFILPGDQCEDISPIQCSLDHGIRALSDIRITRVDRQKLLSQLTPGSGLTNGLAWASIVDKSIMGEWLLNVTRRPAVMRLAHLLCELFTRSVIIGRTEDNSMYFPLTQVALSEALGLSPVHLNRSLQLLRRRKLVSLSRKTLTILDWQQLAEFADFDNNYLHISGKPPVSLRLAS